MIFYKKDVKPKKLYYDPTKSDYEISFKETVVVAVFIVVYVVYVGVNIVFKPKKSTPKEYISTKSILTQHNKKTTTYKSQGKPVKQFTDVNHSTSGITIIIISSF